LHNLSIPFGIGQGVERAIDYTHTLPNGAQVVVRGAPAFRDEEDDFCAFSTEVAERLYDLIEMAEARNPAPGEVIGL